MSKTNIIGAQKGGLIGFSNSISAMICEALPLTSCTACDKYNVYHFYEFLNLYSPQNNVQEGVCMPLFVQKLNVLLFILLLAYSAYVNNNSICIF